MSAYLSTVPPPSSRGPGLRLCAATHVGDAQCNDRARLAELERLAPEELKLIGMAKYRVLRSYARIGLGKAAELFGVYDRERAYGKTTIQYWLDPRAEERCPPAEFVLWLEKQIAKHASPPQGVRCA